MKPHTTPSPQQTQPQIFQDNAGFQIAYQKFLSKKARINTLFQKAYIEGMLEMLVQQAREKLVASKSKKNDTEIKIRRVLEKLGQYDEYYLVIDLREMKIDWEFGVMSALGYHISDENTWTLRKQYEIIHDDYYPIFAAMAMNIYPVLEQLNYSLTALGEHYVINIPLQKANGTYVWVKQMSLPLAVDANGRMIRQLNSYTIVSRFNGVNLPHTPLIFNPNGKRLREVEKLICKAYQTQSKFKLELIEIRVLQTLLEIWNSSQITQAPPEPLNKKGGRKSKPSVTHEMIATRMCEKWRNTPIAPGTVRNKIYEIREKVEVSFDRKILDMVNLALFLKGLHAIDNLL